MCHSGSRISFSLEFYLLDFLAYYPGVKKKKKVNPEEITPGVFSEKKYPCRTKKHLSAQGDFELKCGYKSGWKSNLWEGWQGILLTTGLVATSRVLSTVGSSKRKEKGGWKARGTKRGWRDKGGQK
jgi:hypothetical protein